MPPKTHDISTLPRWAQDRMALQETNIAYWKGKCESALTGQTECFYDLGSQLHGEQALPKGASVIVRVPFGEARMHARRGCIEVYTSGHRAGDLCLKPLSSNHFLLVFHREDL
jgi:hypothetical protein